MNIMKTYDEWLIEMENLNDDSEKRPCKCDGAYDFCACNDEDMEE